MDIVLYSVLLLAGLAFIAYPLFASRWQQRSLQESPKAEHRANLEREKQAVYAAIKDLDFEYKTGKLSDEDYAALRESYRARALNILKQINEAEEGDTGDAAPAEVPPAVERPAETEAAETAASTDTAVETEVDALHCTQCGEANARGSKFCRACGTPLQTELTCSNCGTPRKPRDQFCRICGTSFDPSNSKR
jgi:predicted RNA-binding Zn-ribbon protein involved in translation (DUF1610 family)